MKKILLPAAFFIVLLFPIVAAAQTLPTGVLAFGGRVASVLPCSGGIHFTIIPAKIGPTALIWTPASITFRYGPPSHSGQHTLGLSGPPTVCFLGKIPLFGASVITIGTSAI